jgi:hypothetical protein
MELLPNDTNDSTISLSVLPLDGLRIHKDAKTSRGRARPSMAAAAKQPEPRFAGRGESARSSTRRSLRKIHLAEKLLETGIVAQRVVDWLDL